MNSKMMDSVWAGNFADEWIAAWNAHDLERIFSHYTDDFEMTSPLIVERMKVASGTLKGKENIKPYWQIGLSAAPPLKFELVEVLAGVNSLTLIYRGTSGKLAAEVLIFNESGKAVKGIAHYVG
ncbi:MAG TPA: nuclear transport factor 2 family protein [Sulfuricella sp.]|nr:nuclear transport factor 2 family protein [Sulfuricella sp.]